MVSGDEPQLSQGNPPRERGNTLIVLVLDSSGSMAAIVDDTIGAYNIFIENERATADAHLKHFSSVIFNDQAIRSVPPSPIANVIPLNRRTYVPASNTPLYDALGQAIRETDAFLASHPDFATNGRERVLFAIITDGQENSSHTYTRAHIFDLLTEKQRRGWGVIYLGANQDAFVEAQQIGVSAGNTSNLAAARMTRASTTLHHATRQFMSEQRSDLIDDDMRRELTSDEDNDPPPASS
jgi:hypothetical protein